MSRRAAVYARMSIDRTGEGLGVARQTKLCQEKAAALGWTVVETFTDNDVSATNGRVRPAYARMLRAVEDRTVDAVICYAVDRLTRTPIELEGIISLAESTGVQLATCSGDIDLGNDQGRLMARVLGAFARGETDRKARRQRDANDQRAEAGLPYRCQRAFGFEADGMTVREPEAQELRAAADGVLRGRSLNGLARDFNDRGVSTATGRTWRTTTLKAALLSPRNAGMRRHRGQTVGKAQWPAILDADTVAAVRSILTDPGRSRRGPDRRYLLSGVMTCGRCHEPLSGAYLKEKGNSVYRCMGHVTRRVEPVDEFVTALVVARLSRPDAIDLFTGPRADEGALKALREERESLTGRLDGLAEAFALGEVDRAQLTAGTRRVKARLSEVEQALADAVTDPTLAEVATADDVAQAFAALPQETQRKVIGTLLTVELLPVGSGRRTFAPEQSLKIEWRTG